MTAMNIQEAIANFLAWLQSLVGTSPQKVEPPPIFGRETTISQWQLGKFHCVGMLPNNVRSGCLYTLSCEQIRAVRGKTPAEVRYLNENAKSLIPTHRLTLFYCPPAVRDGKATLGRAVVVFRIERNFRIESRPTTSADWVACGEIAPKVRDRIVEICYSSPTETRYQIKGKILKEGQSAKDVAAGSVKRTESSNRERLRLIPYSGETQKQWEAFVDKLLAGNLKRSN